MRTLCLLLLPCLAHAAFAQLIVHDPGNTAVNAATQSAQAANHLETLRQWATQLEGLNRQIRLLEDQLAVQRRIREVLGDPSLAGTQMVMDQLAPPELARTYGETLRAVRRLADASTSLRRTAEGVYGALDDRTSLRQDCTRQTDAYRRYAVIDRQADETERVNEETAHRQSVLHADLAATLNSLPTASTQAEVDKLNVKVAAINGQLAYLATIRRDGSDQLRAQQIQNENQATTERLDLLEKQLHEERQTIDIVNAWQRDRRLTPGTYTRP